MTEHETETVQGIVDGIDTSEARCQNCGVTDDLYLTTDGYICGSCYADVVSDNNV